MNGNTLEPFNLTYLWVAITYAVSPLRDRANPVGQVTTEAVK